MKVRFLQIFFSLFLLVGFSAVAIAQPANDDCSTAISMDLADNEASLVLAAGNTVGGTPSGTPTSVCSGSWFGDDIWFSFSTGSEFKSNLIFIKSEFGDMAGDVTAVGMALYESCDSTALPFSCFSNGDGTVDRIAVFTTALALNTTYYVRVWSGGSPTDNSGGVRVGAFYDEEAPDVIVWESKFDGGLGDWTSNPTSTDTANWVWTDQPSPGEFRNLTIVSPSSDDGWMLFDADYFTTNNDSILAQLGAPPYPQHSGELISPIIDCTNCPPVSLKWYQNYAALNGTTFFNYSIDGGNTWSPDIIVNDDVEANTATPQPSAPRFFLPDLSGQDSVRFRFTFNGDFYEWLIDDVRLIETERNNLRVNSNFFAIAPNVQTPASQVESFSFLADIYNSGSSPQPNVNLNVTVTEATGTVASFTADLGYGTIGPDSLAENQPFAEYYTPQTDLVTSYTGTYTVSSDSMDFDPLDNTISFTFQTTDSTFAKDTGSDRSLAPADFLWNDGDPHSYSIGNYYYLVNNEDAAGEPLFATTARIGVLNPQDHAGKNPIVWLYAWEDANNDQIAQRDLAAGELTTVGFATFEITGNEPANNEFIVPLTDFNSLDPINPGPAPLTANTAYLLVMQYTADADDDDLFVLATEGPHDYSAQVFRSELDGSAAIRYCHVLGIGNEDYYRMIPGQDNATTNFGHDIAPLVQLNINTQTTVSTTELSDDNITKVFPTPANEVLNVNTELVNVSENVSYKLFDLNGRLVDYKEFSDIQNHNVRFDVKSLTAGSYLLQISTDEGSRTRRVIVQH